MKESEAKELVCPFMSGSQVLQTIEDGYSVGEIYTFSHQNCLTSKCMAWTQKAEFTDIQTVSGIDGKSIKELRKRKDIGEEFSIVRRKLKLYNEDITFGIKIKDDTGYCKRLQ